MHIHVIAPAEWIKRREAAAEAEMDEYTMETVSVVDDTDADMQSELFFDTDGWPLFIKLFDSESNLIF